MTDRMTKQRADDEAEYARLLDEQDSLEAELLDFESGGIGDPGAWAELKEALSGIYEALDLIATRLDQGPIDYDMIADDIEQRAQRRAFHRGDTL